MDSDRLQSDLNALRKLYSLLQIDSSRDPSALDEGSRVFLRKLLDGAAERVFEAHVKIIADNWRSLHETKYLLEEAKETGMLQHAGNSPNLEENIRESILAILNDDQPSQIRHFASEQQTTKSQSVLDEVERDDKSASNLDQGLEDKRLGKMDYKSSDKESVACSASRTILKEVEEKAPNGDDFSKEVDDAIRRIESLIPSLHRLAKPQPTGRKMSNSDSFRKATPVLDLGSSSHQSGGNQIQLIPMISHQLISDTESEQDGKSKGKKIQRCRESSRTVLNAVVPCENDNVHNQGMRTLPCQSNESNVDLYQSRQREVRRKTPTSRSSFEKTRKSVDLQSSIHRVKQCQHRGTVLPGKKPSRKTPDYLPRFSESEETYSESPGSSSWETVETSSSSAASDTTQITTSFSGTGNDNSVDYEHDDFESSRRRYVTSQSSSRYESSSSDDDMYQSSRHSFRHRKESKFKRLKNKLGLIFYHHHHHHHHHIKKSKEAPRSVWKGFGKMLRPMDKKGRGKNPKTTTRKRMQLAKNVSRRQQMGHFHGLVEGLVKHVRRSNKSKLGGERVRKPNVWQNRVKVTKKARVKLLGKDKKPRLVAPTSHLRHS